MLIKPLKILAAAVVIAGTALALTPSAAMDLALPGILFGAVGTAGPRCTSTRRIIVPASKLDELVRRLRSAYGSIAVGDPREPGRRHRADRRDAGYLLPSTFFSSAATPADALPKPRAWNRLHNLVAGGRGRGRPVRAAGATWNSRTNAPCFVKTWTLLARRSTT